MVAIIPTASANQTGAENSISFRWTYIVLPAAILFLSIMLAAGFSHRLPPGVAYHFQDGSPDRWVSRGAFLAWAIILQFVLALLGLMVAAVAAITGRRMQLVESALVKILVSIMGNIVALPQIILAFAMLDIFLYNIYQVHLMPLWLFALAVMLLGGIILGIFFIQAIRQSHGLSGKSLQE